MYIHIYIIYIYCISRSLSLSLPIYIYIYMCVYIYNVCILIQQHVITLYVTVEPGGNMSFGSLRVATPRPVCC